MGKINVRVEFDPIPIRHLAIQCPKCNNWFYDFDICKYEIRYNYQLYNIHCSCPKCDYDFEGATNIQECGHPEVYENVLGKKVEWT